MSSREEFVKHITKTCGDVHIFESADIPCKGCGECCSRGYLAIVLSDVFRIAKHLGMSPAEFVDRHCNYATITRTEMDGKKVSERALGFKLDGGCQFRAEAGCSIYEARPIMCRLYPFASFSIVRGDALAHRTASFPECGTGGFVDKSLYLLHDADGIIDYEIGADCMKEYMDRNGDGPFDARLADNFYRREIMRCRNPQARAQRIQEGLAESETLLKLLRKADESGENLFSEESLKNIEEMFPLQVAIEEKDI